MDCCDGRIISRVQRGFLFLVLVGSLAIAPDIRAKDSIFTFVPSATEVEFTLGATLHTVHGTMKLKSGEIRFDPFTGKASGEVVIDATSAETGNKSRDKKMHKEVLQSARYPAIVFISQRVNGAVQTAGRSQVRLSGIVELEGRPHAMMLTVSIAPEGPGGAVSADTKMRIPYAQWGLKNPSTFFLRVSDHVDVEIHATGQLKVDP